ncbi:MAG: penicillin-binding protein 2 [Aquificaceae bacterium]
MAVRQSLIIFFAFLIFVVIILRFGYIQLIGKEDYVEKIARNFPQLSIMTIAAPRGTIYDRNGNPLAISVPTVSVFVSNSELVQNRQELARRLSSVAGVDERFILKAFESERKSIWLIRHIDKELSPYIKGVIKDTANTSTVGLQEEFKRYYPHGTLASNLLGFTSVDGEGIDGLEYYYNELLKGEQKRGAFLKARKIGSLAKNPLWEEPKTGEVYLTIDLGAQAIAEDIKEKIIKEWSPKAVGIVLLDANSGEILAMASYPSFDPNNPRGYPDSSRRNRVLTDIFEPGSVVKPFFIARALELGYVKPGMWFDLEGGRTEVYGRSVKDVKPSRSMTLEQVLIKSSNVGTIKVARRMSKEDVEKLMKDLGLDMRLEMHTSARPWLPNFNYPANILYASIGQGMAFNLLQLCTAFNALATNRVLMPRVLLAQEPKIIKENVFSKRSLLWAQQNLIRVVEEGTGKQARSEYFYIAGKTGTSQKFDKSTGTYSRQKLVTYFVGYFPASRPKFIAGIMVDEPKGDNIYGGTVAAPYFKDLVERVCVYYGLEPDKPAQSVSLRFRKD